MACLVWAVLEEAVGRFHVQVSIGQIAYSVALGGLPGRTFRIGCIEAYIPSVKRNGNTIIICNRSHTISPGR